MSMGTEILSPNAGPQMTYLKMLAYKLYRGHLVEQKDVGHPQANGLGKRTPLSTRADTNQTMARPMFRCHLLAQVAVAQCHSSPNLAWS